MDPEKNDEDTVDSEGDKRESDGDGGGQERVDVCGEKKAVEIPGTTAEARLSRKGCVSWEGRRKESQRKTEDLICCKSRGGHPGRDNGGRVGADGAGSKYVGGVSYSPTSTKTRHFGKLNVKSP